MSRARYFTVTAAATACLLMGACGSDDDSDSAGDGEAAEPAALAVTISEQGKTTKVEVPESVEAGLVKLSLTNESKRPQSAQLVRVDGDHTAADVQKATSDDANGIPEWVHGEGGVGTIGPGQSSTATVSLEPGKYFVQDDEAGQGAITELEVTGEASDGELPSTTAKVVAKEYRFDPSGLKPGKNEITFENAGDELHHLIAVPINGDATVDDVKKFLTDEGGSPSGPPPVAFDQGTGTSVLDGGKSEVTELEFKKGKYAFICFLPDRAGGPPHFLKGMLQEVTIK